MKKSNLLFALLFVGISIFLNGCKYEEGPFISFQSREDRLINTWEVTASTDENGNDNSDSVKEWTFKMEEGGVLTLSRTVVILGSVQEVNLPGDWALLDDDEVLQLTIEDPTGLASFTEEYFITRLTQDELWLKVTDEPLAVLQLQTEE